MLHLLDIRSLSFISSIISLVLSVCMVYISLTRKTYNGFSQWTTASILYSFGMVLMSLRGILPDFISIIVANTFLMAGFVFIAYGLELFTDSTRRIWLFASLVTITIILCLFFTYYSPNVNARIIAVSTIIALVYGYSGCLVHIHIPRLIDDRNTFLVVLFIIQAMWNVLRVIHAVFIESNITDYMQASGFYSLTVVVFFSGNIFIIIGLIVLNFQRVEFDLRTAMEEVKTLRGIIPICSSCKQIRDDQGIWNQIEAYISVHSEAEFSHSICPECMKKLYPELADENEYDSDDAG